MRYQGVIFDLDGVICYTDRYHYLAWKQMADDEGIYFDETINNRLRGVSRQACLEIILERSDRHYSDAEKLALTDKKNAIYKQMLQGMSKSDLPEAVAKVLDELRSAGVKMAIGSSSKNAKLILERIGLIDAFDFISDGTNITRSKPDPEVFVKAMEGLNLSPEQCLVVEDAQTGIEAATSGGMDSAGIGEAALTATYPMQAIDELPEIVLGTGI